MTLNQTEIYSRNLKSCQMISWGSSGGINAKQVDEGELCTFWNFNLDDCKNEVVVSSEFLIIVEKINDLDKARLIKIIT